MVRVRLGSRVRGSMGLSYYYEDIGGLGGFGGAGELMGEKNGGTGGCENL